MARGTDEIQEEIITAVQDDPNLSGLTSDSKTADWRLWTRVVAASINIFEQLIDLAVIQLEKIADTAKAGNKEWLQNRVLEFQYSSTNPQVVTTSDGLVYYPTIDESLRIVTRSSVKNKTGGGVIIKAAKDSGSLEVNELNALKGYVDKVGFAGIPYEVISLEPDRLRVEATVYYFGEFVEVTVKDNVIAALNGYLESLSSVDNFDGIVVREKLVDAIQAVDGVSGVDTLNLLLNGRPEQDPLGGGNNVSIQRTYEADAGYLIEEDTVGNTYSDTITMVLS